MSGTASVSTKTTVTPVVVTEVKNGTVLQQTGMSIIVRTDEGIKAFSQADVDKRGIKIWRDGKLAEISDFRANDRLSATIVTTKPPRVVSEREVNATLAQSGAGAGAGAGTPAAGAATPGSSTPRPAPAPVPECGGDVGLCPRTLPKTATPLPALGLVGLASLVAGLGLTLRRHRSTH